MPLVQLDFPNPLNTSVQIGDFAYFSNPIDYGTVGNPNGGEWASTTTPHLTSDQSDIIMIGEITTIIPWDGTVNSIICDMPQTLFNQYFSSIVAGGCVVTLVSAGATGGCANYTPAYGQPSITNPQPHPVGQYNSDTYGNSVPSGPWNGGPYIALHFFADNPSLSVNDYMLHNTTANVEPFISTSISSNWCLIDSSNPMYEAGYINHWTRRNPFIWSDTSSGTVSPSFNTLNGLINWFVVTYPSSGVVSGQSVTAQQLLGNMPGVPGGLAFRGGGPISGTYTSTTSTACTGGSFIMFSKDNKVNLSSGLGYYASATLRNDSPDKAELFNIGADIFESSK